MKTIVLKIHGEGPASGKTMLLLDLAEYLADRGHFVRLSDDTCSNQVLKGNVDRRGRRLNTEPMEIYLHVSKVIENKALSKRNRNKAVGFPPIANLEYDRHSISNAPTPKWK